MADISSMTVASRKMYFFAIYVLNHLKENATIKIDESFDVLSLDTTLVNRFDPAVIQEMFKPKPKSKAKKSTLVRPVTNVDPENAVEAIANDFYQAPPENGKSKRKYNKKVIDKAIAVTTAVATAVTTPVEVEQKEQKEQEQKEGVVVADIVSEIVLASKMDLKTTKPKQARKSKKTNEPTTTVNEVAAVNEVAVNEVAVNEVAVNEVAVNEVAVNVTNEVAVNEVAVNEVAVNVTNEVAVNEVAVNVTNEVAVNEVEEPKPKAKRQPKKKATEPEPVVVQEEAEAPMPNLESDVEVSKVKKQNAMKAVADKFNTNNPVNEEEIVTEVVEQVQEQKKQPAKKESAKKESAKKESAKKKKVDNTDAEKENIPVEAAEKPRKVTPIMPQEEEEEESDEIEARLITYSDGKQYLLSDDNSVYDQDTYEMIGTYDPEKYKIIFL